MIRTFSSTIRRREMDAVLTCMVDEKIGPGELNVKLIQTVKESLGCDGAVALRSPAVALSNALRALGLESGASVMLSALAPVWHYTTVVSLGFSPLVLDVDESTGLVTVDGVENGINNGGKVLLLHETMGIMPEIEKIMAFNIPVIEDISQSYGAVVPLLQPQENGSTEKLAGTFGIYAILGLEEFDTITAGGGAILLSASRAGWSSLKDILEDIPSIDVLPDINSALAWVQIKEFKRNEQSRKELFAMFQHSLSGSKNKTFLRGLDAESTIWSFPVVLNCSFKDAKQYAARKEIEILPAYDKTVIAAHEEELSESCIHAKSLYLRCVLFPLYPRLGSEAANKISKVLGSLP